MTNHSEEIGPLSFLGVTRRHVIDPRHPGFSYCGVWKAGAGTQPAKDVPESERCEGGCRTHWPDLSGSPEEADRVAEHRAALSGSPTQEETR